MLSEGGLGIRENWYLEKAMALEVWQKLFYALNFILSVYLIYCNPCISSINLLIIIIINRKETLATSNFYWCWNAFWNEKLKRTLVNKKRTNFITECWRQLPFLLAPSERTFGNRAGRGVNNARVIIHNNLFIASTLSGLVV